MNIEIANRLVSLRKENNLSQEALAEKLGISRQAVSKWERAEASPDTDNLILLSRLYGVSIDELLKTDDEIPMPEITDGNKYELVTDENAAGENYYTEQNNQDNAGAEDERGDYVHVGFEGIHVKDKEGEVHVGWNGIHVDDTKNGENVHIDKNGVYVNGEKYDRKWLSYHHFPMWTIITILYLIIGVCWNAWHPGWMLFLLVPIWDSVVKAIIKKNPKCFAYPVFAALVFLCLGFFWNCWHPGWVVFLTIPLYYSLVEWGRNRAKEENYEQDSRQ